MINKLKNLKNHYCNKFYSTSKLLFFSEYKTYYQNKNQRTTPIIVYTNGKVGSSTIHASIEKTDVPVFHIHYLNSEYLSKYENHVKKEYFRKPNRGQYLWRSLLWRPLFVRKELLHKKPLKFIIIWRDPIAKNISTFFEWIHFSEDEKYWYFKSHQYDMQFEVKTPKDDLTELLNLFLERFPHFTHENWLNIEQNQVLKIPYQDFPFDQQKNFSLINKGKNEVLILKLEAFDQNNYEKIIGDFCGIEGFKYENANLTEDKTKYKAYKLFQNQIEIPESLLEKMYNSQFVKHYYSNEEITVFKNKWKIK